jgi:hypothetical protein
MSDALSIAITACSKVTELLSLVPVGVWFANPELISNSKLKAVFVCVVIVANPLVTEKTTPSVLMMASFFNPALFAQLGLV